MAGNYSDRSAKSAQILNAVLQSMVEPVTILDLQENRLYANPAAIDLLGFDPGSIDPRSVLEQVELRWTDGRLVSLDDLPGLRAMQGELISRQPFVLRSASGQEHLLLASASPLYLEGEMFGVTTVWVDVSLVQRAEQTQAELLQQLRRERAQAEKKAAEAQQRLAELEATVEAIAEPVLIFDNRGVTVRVNSCTVEAFGFDPTGIPRSQLVDRLVLRALDGQPMPVEEMASQKALAGNQSAQAGYLYQSSDGQERVVTATAAPIDIHGSRLGVVSVWHDVTEREMLMKENERQQALLARLVREAPAGIAFLEGPEHRYRLANAAYEHIARYKGPLVGRTIAEVWPEVSAAIVPLLDGVYQDGLGYTAVDQPYQIMRQDGLETDYFTFTFTPIQDANGQIEGVMILAVETTSEVTHRLLVRAERDRLRASEERFRQLADSMPQLVWTARPDGTVDYYNQRYQEYRGISPDTQAHLGTSPDAQARDLSVPLESGWQWAPVLHPADLQATLEAWQHALASGTTYQIEHRVQMSDGNYCWHLSRGEPARDETGQVARWYGTATNIHDLKQAQAELKTYADRLEQSNRDLQEFAFVASHDLQEPLRKIEAFGDALLRPPGDSLDERQRDYLERMRNAAGRMRKMVDDLLALSRVTTRGLPFEWVDLTEVVGEVIADLEMQIRRTGGRVECGVLPRVQADPSQMRQLFQNLLGNALKFHLPERPPLVYISAGPSQANQVDITISDNGIGFNEQESERIFQPFQRLVGRAQYDGSGMGLAICRKIVERHSGQIQARSAAGHGSHFLITLPVRQAAPLPGVEDE